MHWVFSLETPHASYFCSKLRIYLSRHEDAEEFSGEKWLPIIIFFPPIFLLTGWSVQFSCRLPAGRPAPLGNISQQNSTDTKPQRYLYLYLGVCCNVLVNFHLHFSTVNLPKLIYFDDFCYVIESWCALQLSLSLMSVCLNNTGSHKL